MSIGLGCTHYFPAPLGERQFNKGKGLRPACWALMTPLKKEPPHTHPHTKYFKCRDKIVLLCDALGYNSGLSKFGKTR